MTKSTLGLTLFAFLCGLMFMSHNAFADQPQLTSAALQAEYIKLDKQLSNNQFKRPLYIKSAESSQNLKGEIYAVVDYPFNTVKTALNNPSHWCDLLILHVNIKYCHAESDNSANKASAVSANTILTVDLGKKFDQPLTDTYRVNFNYREVVKTTDYFALELNAKDGPLGTHDYFILVEAAPLKDGHTFLHFTYTYSFGLSGRLAMKTYLITAGRDKVGFTNVAKLADGKIEYIKGVRGVVERNTMRYYLAIDAYLNALNVPADAQLEKRLQNWFLSTNEYAQQLHDVEKDDYLAMKHKEYARQQTAQ